MYCPTVRPRTSSTTASSATTNKPSAVKPIPSHRAAGGPSSRIRPLRPLVRRARASRTAVERVGVSGRLAGAGRRVVGKRDPKRAAFPSVERVHLAGHSGRHHLRCDRVRIEQRAIDNQARRLHTTAESGRAHGPTFACTRATLRVPNKSPHQGLASSRVRKEFRGLQPALPVADKRGSTAAGSHNETRASCSVRVGACQTAL